MLPDILKPLMISQSIILILDESIIVEGGFRMGFGSQVKKEAKPASNRSLDELFRPATELEAAHGLKIAIWGRAKVGKSHFCLTPPGKIFVIDTESAIKTNVQSFPTDVKERVFVADVLQFSGLKEESGDINYGIMLDVLEDAITKILQAVKTDGESNVTVVIDSASDLWDWLGIWLNEEAPGVSHIGHDKDKVNRLEWGKANKRYARDMLKLIMSGCNIICTYKAKDAVGADGADLGFAKPRWQKNSKHLFDLVGVIEKSGDKRVLKFTGSDNGGRYGDKIPELENPTWSRLLEHLEKNCGVTFN